MFARGRASARAAACASAAERRGARVELVQPEAASELGLTRALEEVVRAIVVEHAPGPRPCPGGGAADVVADLLDRAEALVRGAVVPVRAVREVDRRRQRGADLA